VPQQEAVQAAVMVEMAVTQHQPIEPSRIDIQQTDLPIDDLRRITEVQQEFRQRAAGHRRARRETPKRANAALQPLAIV
jgi:hypothetical protein